MSEIKQDNKSVLKMIDLYFSKISFENNRNLKNTTLNVKYNINVAINKENNNLAKVVIDTVIISDNESLSLSLQTIGIFEVENHLEQDLKTLLLHKNSVAIMFPFIRSQVSLITTQPGLTPIMLQPIDVNSLVEESHK